MAKSKSLFNKLFNKTPGPYKSARADNIFTAEKVSNDQKAQLCQYENVSTLFAIVDGLAGPTSQAKWKLYRKAKPGQRPEDRVEVKSHQALEVWNRPNKFMTQQEFVETIQQHLDLTGEAYWYVASVTGRGVSIPMELWPMRPDTVVPIPSPTNFLAGYLYITPDGEKIPYDVDQVIQLRWSNPMDFYQGVSPVKSLLTDLRATKMAAQYNENFFKNGAEPGGIVELDETVTDEEWDELVTRWREQHQGVANAHRVAFLEKGVWKERKFSQKDMQFAELRDVNREIIREAYRFPKAMLGTTEDVNKAVAEAAETQLYRNLIVPRLDRIKAALNHYFLPLFYANPSLVDVEFDYDNPVPDDRQADNEQLIARATAVKTLVDAGAELADALEAVGLPPMKEKELPKPVMPQPTQEQPEQGANVNQPEEARNG